MSGFGFSKEQEMFRKMVPNFSQKEVSSGAKQEDNREMARKWSKKLASLDLIGLGAPPEYGGQGVDWGTVAIAVEEMSKSDINLGAFPVLPALISKAMDIGSASQEIRQKYFPAMCKRGGSMLCLSITEPDCGSDVAAIRMKAVREGEHYILNGEKTSVSRGMTADLCYIFAETDSEVSARGVTSFLVPFDSPRITKSRILDMGFKNFTRAYHDVRIPVDHRLTDEGKGFYMLMGTFDFFRVFLALSVLGAAKKTSINEAIDYSKQRTAFGQPITRYGGVSFKIAEHATRIESGKLFCYRTFWLADQGVVNTKEAAICK